MGGDARATHVVTGTLDDLPTLAAAASIGPPATLIVGAVAALGSGHAEETRHAERAAR